MDLALTGRRALVCGASAGIGRAAAVELAGLGARVVALARRAERLEALLAELPGDGHQALVADLDDRAGLEATVERLLAEGGPVHVLVNNTAGPKAGPLLDASPDEFLQGFQRHVLAAQLLVQRLVPGMRQDGYGRIVNVVSTSVRIPIPNLGVSNTIRGAMASWAKTMAGELAPMGITVNNVLPGFTDTERLEALMQGAAARTGQEAAAVAEAWRVSVPMGRFGRPEELGAVIAFLASPAAAYVTGESLRVDGGRTGSI